MAVPGPFASCFYRDSSKVKCDSYGMRSRREIIRVGQNHIFIRIYGVHTVFLAGKSP